MPHIDIGKIMPYSGISFNTLSERSRKKLHVRVKVLRPILFEFRPKSESTAEEVRGTGMVLEEAKGTAEPFPLVLQHTFIRENCIVMPEKEGSKAFAGTEPFRSGWRAERMCRRSQENARRGGGGTTAPPRLPGRRKGGLFHEKRNVLLSV